MKHEVIYLSEDKRVTLTTYLHEKTQVLWNNRDEWQPKRRPAIIICPGGGYVFLSQREGEPVAMAFMQQGYQAFVLHYSIHEASAYPGPLEDISKAVWLIRSHAEEWGIDPNQIAVGGFSAGGHVSAMLATQWNTPGLCRRLGIPEGGNKPNAQVLCYAPVDLTDLMSRGVEVTGSAMLSRQTPQANIIDYVSEETAPAFLWMTREDMLNCDGYMRFAMKLHKNNIPFEMHVFGEGPHGMSLSNNQVAYGYHTPVNVDRWFPLCIGWLNKLFGFGFPEEGKTCSYTGINGA